MLHTSVGVFLYGVVCVALSAQTIITFDVPSAQSTEPASVNNSGTVVGSYLDSAGVSHGFSRTSSGVFTTFDPPGSVNTFGYSINASGTVAGFFYDSSTFSHCFLRAPDGTIMVFDPPGAFESFVYSNLNANGALAGSFFDDEGLKAFFRTAAGEYTTINFGQTHEVYLYPQIYGLNNADTLTGNVQLTSERFEGFVRVASGPFTFFDFPGAIATFPLSVNENGTIAGYYQNGPSGPATGFLRSRSGAFTSFQVDGAGTNPVSMNSSGVVTGYYNPRGAIFGGFVRNVAGEIATFEVNGATATYPECINDYGTIAGQYEDTSGLTHGFVLTP